MGARLRRQEGLPEGLPARPAAAVGDLERQGFRKVNEAPFHFSDHEYGAFAADLDVPEHAPSVFTDPMVLNRPEDQLDEAGILEKSMERGASNPHAEWAERRHH